MDEKKADKYHSICLWSQKHQNPAKTWTNILYDMDTKPVKIVNCDVRGEKVSLTHFKKQVLNR